VLCPPHLSRDEAAAKMGYPAAFARCPWLKPQFNQAAFRGLKAPAPSGKTGAGAKAEADSLRE
jgi:hypothetical protein